MGCGLPPWGADWRLGLADWRLGLADCRLGLAEGRGGRFPEPVRLLLLEIALPRRPNLRYNTIANRGTWT